MHIYTAKHISEIIQGKAIFNGNPGSSPVKTISIDSRTVLAGGQTLFFALKSHRNNGHKYILELIGKGVKAFVISEKHTSYIYEENVVFIYVKDTLSALQKLASWNRQQFEHPIIGITGSNGKTIVKEWLYDLLKSQYSIARSPKSYNSQIGVPLSAWIIQENHDLAILEAGISKPGEMEKLQPIVQPQIGIFTNIGTAHQENFTSLEQKINEKLTLFRDTQHLIFSVDQEMATGIIKGFCIKNQVNMFSWSSVGNEAVVNFHYSKKKNSTKFQAHYKEQSYSFTIPFTDKSAIENACHCFVAALALGASLPHVGNQMQQLSNIAMRLEMRQGNNNCLLINDFYNSDINSLAIALNVLNNQAKKSHLSKVLILSDIQQSGVKPAKLYKKVNQMAVDAGVNEIVGIGTEISKNQGCFKMHGSFYLSTPDFLQHLNGKPFQDAVILLKGVRSFNFEDIASKLQQKAHQTVLEINLDAMVENLNTFRSLLKPSTKIMAMVKAFSYGSGSSEIATLLQYHKIDYLAVAVADEGIELRKSGITIPIVVMNPEIHSFQNIIDYRLEPNIYSIQLLKDFISYLKLNASFDFPIHIKLDTGMNRLGFKTLDEIIELTKHIKDSGNIVVSSVFSHLAASDEPNMDEFTLGQIGAFKTLSKAITLSFNYKINLHVLNSAGIERFPEHQFDMARLGIGLYGISSTGIPLKNISTLKTTISQVKEVSTNETIGYSRKGMLGKKGEIAVIPIGYADGLSRILGNGNGRVFINGYYAPIVGNICMDMCMLDISHINAEVGDEVEVFGSHVLVSELAEKSNTIPYEILTGISQRVKRIYTQE